MAETISTLREGSCFGLGTCSLLDGTAAGDCLSGAGRGGPVVKSERCCSGVDGLARREIFEVDGAETCGSGDSSFGVVDDASAGGEVAVSEGARLVAAIVIDEGGALGASVMAGRSTVAAEAVRLGMACLRSEKRIEVPEMRTNRTAATVHSSFCPKGRFHQETLGRLGALELDCTAAAPAFRAKG